MDDIKTGTISITGLSDLEKRLLDFPDKIARNILARALSKGAAVIRDEARQIAPKDTGEMALDIMIKKARMERGSTLLTFHVFVRTGKKSRLAGKKRNVQRDSFYWRFVEFGHMTRQGKDTVGPPRFVAARPFMRPAFETMKEQAVEAIRLSLAENIDKEAAK